MITGADFLAIDHVGKRFAAHQVLDDVCFTVPRGSVATLLGPSGCGKTTMLRAIAGLEGIDTGRVVLDGRLLVDGGRAHVPPDKRGIGMVFQSYALWPHKTVAQNVALGLLLRGDDKAATAGKVERMLALVGLPGMGDRYPGSLSGGQQQRVSLARALALEPACLLFDEPLSNLDQGLRERMRFEIREILVAAGITAVYVTHDQSEAMVISDQLLVMNQGRIVQVGTPRDVYRHPSTRFVAEFLGGANLLPLDLAASDPHRGLFATEGGLLKGEPCPQVPEIPHVAFRPENVQLSTGPEAIPAMVENCTFLGGTTLGKLRVGTAQILLSLPGYQPLSPGQAVGISMDPRDIVLVAG